MISRPEATVRGKAEDIISFPEDDEVKEKR
jgi:hypothetical protein